MSLAAPGCPKGHPAAAMAPVGDVAVAAPKCHVWHPAAATVLAGLSLHADAAAAPPGPARQCLPGSRQRNHVLEGDRVLGPLRAGPGGHRLPLGHSWVTDWVHSLVLPI